MGAYIEINVVIESGSVAQGTVPDNVVVVGNLAKIACILDDYHRKEQKAQNRSYRMFQKIF